MEKKILKVVTTFCGCLTVLACVCLYFFPGMKETMAAEPEIGIVPEEKVEVQVQAPQLPPVEDGADEDVVADDYMEKLNIQLPEGVHGGMVSISNDYLTQTVKVRFAKP